MVSKITPAELRCRMRAAIAEEREGIRSFDTAAIRRANEAKATVLEGLHEASPAERPALYAVLDELKVELRCNLVLLHHARAYIADAAERARAERPPSRIESATAVRPMASDAPVSCEWPRTSTVESA